MSHSATPTAPCAWELRAGQLLPVVSIPLTDRGFRYGQHLFETLPVRHGRWAFWDKHLALLTAAARAAGFPPLPDASAALLPDLPARPEWTSWNNALARVYWTAGDGPPSAPPAPGRFFVMFEPLPPPPAQPLLRLHEATAPYLPLTSPREAGPSFSGAWKTGNYWAALQSLAEAQQHGADEALRFNPANRLVSACLGNVFFYRKGRWWTPPLTEGARPGVARAWLLAHKGAEEASLSRAEARHITRWLICNSRLGPFPAAWPHLSETAHLAEIHAWRQEFEAASD